MPPAGGSNPRAPCPRWSKNFSCQPRGRLAMAGPNLLQLFLSARALFMALLGDRCEKDILERGPARQLLQILLEHHAAIGDYHDLVANLRNLGQDMRRQHHRAISRQLMYQPANLVYLPRVEANSRLVKHQHWRIVDQRLRQP